MLSDKKLKELYEKYLKEDRHDYYIKNREHYHQHYIKRKLRKKEIKKCQ